MHEDELKRCQAEITRLQAENLDLRRAAESFGSLAERLNRELRSERRSRMAERGAAQKAAAEARIGLVCWSGVEVA